MKKNILACFLSLAAAAPAAAQAPKVVELNLTRPDVLDVWVMGVPKYERDSSSFIVTKGTPPYSFLWKQTDSSSENTFYVVTVLDGRGCSVEISTYVSNLPMLVERSRVPAELRAYPNPVADVLHIPLGCAENEKPIIRLFDAEGRLLLEKAADGGAALYQLSLAGYPSGLYFVQVVAPSSKITHSVVKGKF
jgi:hypothetical protein